MSTLIPRISDGFTNIKGQTFTNVREIAYKKGELFGNLGKFVAETEHERNLFYDEDYDPGVYIYQTYHNPNLAYRIYNEFADYNFNGYDDDILIQSLYDRSKNISLTSFPTGVVTLDGKIIGQEIPYYSNSICLSQINIEKLEDKNPITIYKKILTNLKELSDNGIGYLDIHPKNFMIDLTDSNQKVDIIDFDLNYTKFDLEASERIDDQLYNFRKMVDRLNKKFNILDITGEFSIVNSFQDTFEQLNDFEKKLLKK